MTRYLDLEEILSYIFRWLRLLVAHTVCVMRDGWHRLSVPQSRRCLVKNSTKVYMKKLRFIYVISSLTIHLSMGINVRL